MNSKQTILQQETDTVNQLIDQTEITFATFKAAADAWEADNTDANRASMQAALDAYKEAMNKLASRIGSLRRAGYKIEVREE